MGVRTAEHACWISMTRLFAKMVLHWEGAIQGGVTGGGQRKVETVSIGMSFSRQQLHPSFFL